MFRPMALALCLLSATPNAALAANPWEELMGPGKPNLWTDPEGRFWLDLPVGWRATPRGRSDPFVDFWKQHPDYGYTAHVEVEIRSLPPNTKATHFATKVQDEIAKHAPAFQVTSRQRAQVSGVTALHTSFRYQEKNNAALQTEVEQYVFVIGERGFIVSLLTPAGAQPIFVEDFEKMIRNFGGRGSDDDAQPVPRAKKRVRAGEMVNPDALPY